jgi:hypothetical protein
LGDFAVAAVVSQDEAGESGVHVSAEALGQAYAGWGGLALFGDAGAEKEGAGFGGVTVLAPKFPGRPEMLFHDLFDGLGHPVELSAGRGGLSNRRVVAFWAVLLPRVRQLCSFLSQLLALVVDHGFAAVEIGVDLGDGLAC